MTDKEKAQAYDEMVQRVKELHEAGNALTKQQMEIVLPELAESENKKISNLIYCIVRDREDVKNTLEANGVSVNDALAYLEKQKEQKPVDEQFPPLEGLDAIKAKYYDDGFKNGFDEGVESVRPAEWSEEDERMRKHIISDLIEFCDCETDEELISDYQDEIKWLKSLRPQSQWKPNNEQMKALHAASSLSSLGEYVQRHLWSLYEQLKKLM